MNLTPLEHAAPIAETPDKLWILASSPFLVVGEAHILADGDLALTWLGNVDPETKLGLTPGTFPKTIRDALALMHPDDVSGYRQAVAHSLATGAAFDASYRLADGRGGWRWIEGRAVPTEVRDGQWVAWIFINRDFTAQCAAEAALRQSIQELAAASSALRSEQDKFWQTAANAFSVLGEARVTDSGMELDFFGDVPPEEKLGLAPGSLPRNLEQLMAMMHPEDVKSYLQKVEHSLATGEPFRVVYRVTDGRGGWRWLQARAFSLEQREDRYIRWLHDTLDITEQRETEEALRHSLEELRQLKTRLLAENQFLREEAGLEAIDVGLIGRSPALSRVLQQADLVAVTSSTVLISGETGTGKELVARAIHRRSPRWQRLFVAVNCAALPATLVESELFGHEKGAFTGAIARRAGRFEQADGGTLFLDEVGELPLDTQAKMLRVLQFGEFERVGGSRLLKTDVRIIAASNRDLEQAVREGQFRSDLYHRLAIFPIHLPPLRERREDIPLLAAYLVTGKARQLGRKIDPLTPAVVDRLTRYDWPGNVRELENILERAMILSPGSTLRLDALQLGPAERPAFDSPACADNSIAEDDTLQTHERGHILRVCQATGWKIKGSDGAARRLDLNPGTLYARMKKLGIRRPAVPG
ncbi:MAG: sigma 54-interacting transcriptional regulator [Candidatus Contendobacter sp.]|jgi:DNA-binding NtrC family response regulator|nr:sigma 54-interacting transcriptional regulator [Candidatus Contendobacter sp.]